MTRSNFYIEDISSFDQNLLNAEVTHLLKNKTKYQYFLPSYSQHWNTGHMTQT